MKNFSDFENYCMLCALDEAQKAFDEEEVPVGCVIADENKIIATAHNQVEHYKDATCHAEILCLKKAAKVIGDWRLNNLILFSTLEPCSMCAGAAILFRIKEII